MINALFLTVCVLVCSAAYILWRLGRGRKFIALGIYAACIALCAFLIAVYRPRQLDYPENSAELYIHVEYRDEWSCELDFDQREALLQTLEAATYLRAEPWKYNSGSYLGAESIRLRVDLPKERYFADMYILTDRKRESYLTLMPENTEKYDLLDPGLFIQALERVLADIPESDRQRPPSRVGAAHTIGRRAEVESAQPD